MGSKKGSGLKGLRNSLTTYFFSKKGKRIPDPKNMKDFGEQANLGRPAGQTVPKSKIHANVSCEDTATIPSGNY